MHEKINLINLTTAFWGLFRPRRALIVPTFVICCILLLLILDVDTGQDNLFSGVFSDPTTLTDLPT